MEEEGQIFRGDLFPIGVTSQALFATAGAAEEVTSLWRFSSVPTTNPLERMQYRVGALQKHMLLAQYRSALIWDFLRWRHRWNSGARSGTRDCDPRLDTTVRVDAASSGKGASADDRWSSTGPAEEIRGADELFPERLDRTLCI